MKNRHIFFIITVLILIAFIIFFKIEYGNNISNIKEGTFEWIPSFETKSIKGTYYYSDDYFTKIKGQDKNAHLRTMAMNLALASTPSIDKENNTDNITNLLKDISFNDITTYDYDEIKEDTIGTVISHKKVNNYEVIIVALRGEKYELEWKSNFLVSDNGNVKGFDLASIKVLDRIKEYINKNNIDNKTKILVTGYSRSGAIANLVGVYLNEHLTEYNLNSDNDLYIYTFEAPNSTTNKKVYKNIHNIVNENDIITYAYPNKWDLNNNGIIEYVGDRKLEIPTYELKTEIKMNNIFSIEKTKNKVKIYNYLEDLFNWFVTGKTNLNKNNKYIDNIDRKLFNNTLEVYMPKIIDYLNNKTDIEMNNLYNFITNDYFNDLKDNNKLLFVQLVMIINRQDIKDSDITLISNKLLTSLERSRIKRTISNDDYNIIKEIISDKNNYILLHRLFYNSYNEKTKFMHLSTLVHNFDVLSKQHYTNTNYELVKKGDSYYITN